MPRSTLVGFPEQTVEGWLRDQLGATHVVVSQPTSGQPTWLVDAVIDGRDRRLAVCGDRWRGLRPFSLRHELSAQSVLHAHGIPVPAVHGWISELQAIVMDATPGQFDFVGLARVDRERITGEYMTILARIHRLPRRPFLAAGLVHAATPADAGKVGLAALEAVYRRVITRPDPFAAFALGWLRRNPPPPANRESVVLWGASRFHQQSGVLTGVVDCKLAHIGDPMMDLAGIRARDSVVQFGDLHQLYAQYQAAGGFEIDLAAIQHHQIALCLFHRLALLRTRCDPAFHADYMTSLLWLVQTDLWSIELIAEQCGLPLCPPALPIDAPARFRSRSEQLVRLLRGIDTTDESQARQLQGSYLLARHLQRIDEIGATTTAMDLDDVCQLLKRPLRNWDDAQAALEQFISTDDGTHDVQVTRLMYDRYMRLRNLLGPPESGMASHLPIQLHNLDPI